MVAIAEVLSPLPSLTNHLSGVLGYMGARGDPPHLVKFITSLAFKLITENFKDIQSREAVVTTTKFQQLSP